MSAVRAAVAVLSLAVLCGSGYMWVTYNSFTTGLKKLDVISSKPKTDVDGKAQNILIVGNDDRSGATPAELAALGTGQDGGSLNTDTMMIVHVPANGRAAVLVSIPRDSYVAIPGHGMGKINSAYADGYNEASGSDLQRSAAGARLAISTVQQLTGLTIDHFAQVDLLGFYKISQAVGPVTVNMCEAVTEPNSGIQLHQGLNPIVGKQALAFVRQRYGFPDGEGDLDRVQRERYFLAAVFRKESAAGVLLNPAQLQKLLHAIQASLYLDTGLDPVKLAAQIEELSANKVSGHTIPVVSLSDTVPGWGSVVTVNPAAVQTFVRQLVSRTAPATSPSAPHTVAPHAPGTSTPARTTAPATRAPDAGCIQ